MTRILFLVFSAYFIAMVLVDARRSGAVAPAAPEAQDADNVAVSLMHGRGFTIDYSDPEWRRPYEAANADGSFDEALSRRSPTHVPPLPPLVAALVYTIFGRRFLVLEIVNALLMAAGLSLICMTTKRAFGDRAALLTAGILFLSSTYVFHIIYWTVPIESLAIILIALLIITLSRRAAIASIVVLLLLLLLLWRPLPPAVSAPKGAYDVILFLAIAAPFVTWRRRANIDRPTTLMLFSLVLLGIEPLIAACAALSLTAACFGDDAIVGDHAPCSSTN